MEGHGAVVKKCILVTVLLKVNFKIVSILWKYAMFEIKFNPYFHEKNSLHRNISNFFSLVTFL